MIIYLPYFRKGGKNMSEKAFAEIVKITENGQVTIPKAVLDVLGAADGDSVTFVVEGKTIHMVNSAVYAMQMLQQEMAGKAECSGLDQDGDVMALVKEVRDEDEKA